MAAGPSISRIAIADDDSDSLDMICEFLRSSKTEILKASSGSELVELLAEHGPFDLIVTDIDMPWMEGLAVIRSARAADIRAPVIVITGLTRPNLESTVADLGNARLLHKPIELSALRKAVAELTGGAV
jgi:CheY-like chemotaxis protein